MDSTPIPDEQPTETEVKLNRKVDRSLLISLVAVAISLIGTVVSVYEARVLRDQQDLQVAQKSASAWPYVAVAPSINLRGDSNAVLTMEVTNRGIGPAILGDAHYYFDHRGERLDLESWSIDDSFRLRYPELRLFTTQNMQLDSLVLPPGEMVATFTVKMEGKVAGKSSQVIMNELASAVSVEFCYCSVYGDCWYRGGGSAPTKNPDCRSYIDY